MDLFLKISQPLYRQKQSINTRYHFLLDMRFAHLADCHIGSWRDEKLKQLSCRSFIKAVDLCIKKQVDFVLIAGDLFNTALPNIDSLKDTVAKLKELDDNEISVYVVPGSHDTSPSGKTMLHVLENAGLLVNVVKGNVENNLLKLQFTVDKKTNAKITGMLGRRGMLERSYYESLDTSNLEKEPGFKIFMLHTALSEFKPAELDKMDSSPLSLLPKGFDYYAAGHVHYVFQKKEQGYGLIAYPGPLFPNNFREIEKLGQGGFYIYDDGKLEFQTIKVVNTLSFTIDADGKTPEKVEQEIISQIKHKEFNNTIVTIRVQGTLSAGRTSDIDWKHIFDLLHNKSAFYVMKSTTALKTKEYEEIKVQSNSVEEVEESLIKENAGKSFEKDKEYALIKSLMKVLSLEKREGERVQDFESRLKEEVDKTLSL
jgi:DNA repair exonuclease SbcCD nuclease subunit